MFTGIIEELGTIRGVSLTKDGGELQIAATTVLGGTKLGDSIAVNGTCLTVTKLEKTALQPLSWRKACAAPIWAA